MKVPRRLRRRFNKILRAEDFRNRDDHNALVFTRWHIFKNPLFGVYVHRMVRPDPYRDLHDHPWSFISISLSGGYRERYSPGGRGVVPTGAARQGTRLNTYGTKDAQRVHFMSAYDWHLIDRIIGKESWTLLLRGPKKRHKGWGFLARYGIVDSEDYADPLWCTWHR